MGFTRFLYNLFGIDYVGTREKIQIDQARHQKYLVCTQIRHSNLKLKSIKEKDPTPKPKRFHFRRNKKYFLKKQN